MRLMGIFDWWLAVLDFISKSVDNPTPTKDEVAKDDSGAARTKVFLQVRKRLERDSLAQLTQNIFELSQLTDKSTHEI